MDALSKLRQLYEQSLAVGPFPTQECRIAGIVGSLHAQLTMYLADIAGIASRGQELAKIDDRTRTTLRAVSAISLWDKEPWTRERITAEKTPRLYAVMCATEEARRLIVRELAS